TAVPPGCAFHPRCPQRFDPCDRNRPALTPDGVHVAACWLSSANSAGYAAPADALFDAAVPGGGDG
ncbi:MAG: methionine ABC transporter ATP-binding protein, partial [Pseudomonadota bacterium]